MNVRYRDVPYAIPFVMQIWLFLSGVVYAINALPEKWQWLRSGPASGAETAWLLPFPARPAGRLACASARRAWIAETHQKEDGLPHQGSEARDRREARPSDQDTRGSAEVQIALLTARINELTEHLRTYPEDHHSRRAACLKLVGRRRRLLQYLQKRNLEGYRALIQELGLRR